MVEEHTYTAFSGSRLIASGDVKAMVLETKACLDRGEAGGLLIFDDRTGRQIDFDFRGTAEEVLARLATHPGVGDRAAGGPDRPRTGPGRPKLGVVSREVSLLPRHWEWLEQQPNGISAALRRLVDDARGKDPQGQRTRAALDAASAFLFAMAGNLPGYEEASRALWARDRQRFEDLTREWPEDIRAYSGRLAREAFEPPQGSVG